MANLTVFSNKKQKKQKINKPHFSQVFVSNGQDYEQLGRLIGENENRKFSTSDLGGAFSKHFLNQFKTSVIQQFINPAET